MKNNISDLVKDIVASPLGEVIASVGEGVAEAQQALDEGSLAKTLEIYSEGGEEALRVLREIGYRPTFYALPDTTGEVRVSMRLGKSAAGTATQNKSRVGLQPAVVTQLARMGRNIGIKPRIYATPVDAGYANRYGYQANISAKLSFKIVPVPAPDGVDDIRVLPNFVGKPVSESRDVADSLGLEILIQNVAGKVIDVPDENGIVSQQEPSVESRDFVLVGDEVVLTVG
jgi:hypothetical protein